MTVMRSAPVGSQGSQCTPLGDLLQVWMVVEGVAKIDTRGLTGRCPRPFAAEREVGCPHHSCVG